jgi:cysteinyl-tRNA synthetase
MYKSDIRFRETKETVHAALADNFNSRAAVSTVSELINDLNKEFKASNIGNTSGIFLEITSWITRLLATFGFGPSLAEGRIGWAEDRDPLRTEIKKAVRYRDSIRAKAISKSGFDDIDVLTHQLDSTLSSPNPILSPYLEGIKKFTTSVSRLVSSNAPFTDFLKECDRFRDETMLELGVSIDDTDFGIATIRFADASRLINERDRKSAAESALAEKKAAEKQKRKEEEDRKAREKLEKGKVAPRELFRNKEYSEWDDEVYSL